MTKKAATLPVQPWLPWWATYVATFVAAVYLVAVFVEAVHPGRTHKILGRPVAYFAQIAKLFAERSTMSIDFRAMGFRCDTHQFAELDVAPYFPMHAGDKESRFDRTMFFYLKNREVQVALQDYLIERHNARVAAGELTDLPRIGGIALLSLRIPIPRPGTDFPRYRHVPLSGIPKDWARRSWFVTGPDERMRRCAEASP
jgi:hypothetical protein